MPTVRRKSGGRDPRSKGRFACAIFALLAVVPMSGVVGAGAFPGFAWIPEVVDRGVEISGSTSIGLNASGVPHIAYADVATGTVRYARWTDTGWVHETVRVGGWAQGAVSLVLDPQGLPHLTLFDRESESVKYARRTAVGWTVSHVDVSLSEGYSSLALDGTGAPHIAYTWDNGRLRYAQWNGTFWIAETVDYNVITARSPSLVLDSQGRPRIAYHGNGNVWHAAWAQTGWDIDVVDSGSSPESVTLGLDSANTPSIGFRDRATKTLRFARWDGTAWAVQTVDDSGDVGWDARMRLDPQGTPHFSYYDRTLGRLKYALLHEGSWSIHVVDLQRVAGWYPDLAIGSDGRPHFSYFSWSEVALRYARGTYGLGVRTWPGQALQPSSATLVAEITSLGDLPQVAVSFDWRREGGDWYRVVGATVTAPGFVTAVLGNLTPGQTFEYRAVAIVDGAETFGEVVAFVTPEAARASGLDVGALALSVAVVVLLLVVVMELFARRRSRENAAHPRPADVAREGPGPTEGDEGNRLSGLVR